MDIFFNNSEEINLYAQIQKELYDLKPNSSDEEISQFINQIPSNVITQKDKLMIICQLFAYYPRNNSKKVRRNAFKLFEKIMVYIKQHLQGQSTFFWNIFGGLFYFKQYMYEEGLISKEKIIQEAISDETYSVAEYFLPEIFENYPEIFESEIKHHIQSPYSLEYINEFKELRIKHLKWLQESNDYDDPIYREIEKDQLRFAIKTDDIDTFQSILANSNLSINSEIKESTLENSYFRPSKVKLIDFAIEFESIKIFKYLVMNDATIEIESAYSAIRNRNYEMIHIVESKDNEKFNFISLCASITCWNYEMTVYLIENYFPFLEDEISEENDNKVLEAISNMCYSINFQFYQNIFLPFVKKNSRFIDKNINEIIYNSIRDNSAYFTKLFIKYPGIDVNKIYCRRNNRSFLSEAIISENINVIEFLLNHFNIDINSVDFAHSSPFFVACANFSDLKIIELFCKNSNLDIYWRDIINHFTAIDMCIINNNFLAIEFIFNYFPDYNEKINLSLFFHCLINHYFITMKLLLKYTKNQDESRIKDIIGAIRMHHAFSLNSDELNPILEEFQT